MSKVEKALKVVEQLYSTINQYEYQAGVYGTPITLGMWITEAKDKIKKYEEALEVIAGGLDMSNALEDPYEYSTLRDEVLKVQEEARLALGMGKVSWDLI